MRSSKNLARTSVTLGLLSAMVFGTLPAFAEPIEQTVTAGTLSASLSAAPTFGGVTSTHAPQNSDSSTPTMTADDSTGNALGWDVSLVSSNLVDGSYTIPATAVSVQTLGTIAATSGSLTGVTSGAGTGAINTARNVLSASAGNGQGTYTEDVTLRIVVPANVHSGTYAGTLTITNTSK